jgi:hypothetical protein
MNKNNIYIDTLMRFAMSQGSGGGGKEEVSLAVTENGTYTPDEGKVFNEVNVACPVPKTETALAVSANGTYTPEAGKVFNEVNVSCPVPKTETALTVSENGYYTPPSGQVYSRVGVEVPDSLYTMLSKTITELVYTDLDTQGRFNIGDWLFANQRQLAYVNVNCSDIGEYAFYNNTALKNVILPFIRTIDQYSFNACTALETVYAWPSEDPLIYEQGGNLRTLAAHAFDGCTSLRSVVVSGRNFRTIGSSAFQGCAALEELVVWAVNYIPTLGTAAFFGCPATLSIYVPDAKLADFQAASGWSDYASQIKPFSQRPTA